jgi:hypothetical protein
MYRLCGMRSRRKPIWDTWSFHRASVLRSPYADIYGMICRLYNEEVVASLFTKESIARRSEKVIRKGVFILHSS